MQIYFVPVIFYFYSNINRKGGTVLEDVFDKAQQGQAVALAPTLELDPAKYWQYVEDFAC